MAAISDAETRLDHERIMRWEGGGLHMARSGLAHSDLIGRFGAQHPTFQHNDTNKATMRR